MATSGMSILNSILIMTLVVGVAPLVGAQQTAGPGLGKPADAAMIERWNWDVFPNGQGLPSGSGTALTGQSVYERYCRHCHGLEGSGASADELAGAAHGLTDDPPDKTIGTYWPYATTLFDFTRRSMPLNQPGVLSNDELYSVTAYLLYLNGIIDQSFILDAQTLPRIEMPNRNGFINIYERSQRIGRLAE